MTSTPRPLIGFCAWAAASIPLFGAGALLVGIRPDLLSRWAEPRFLLEAGLVLCLAGSAVFAALALSVPDRRKPWLQVLPIAALICWTAVAAYMAASEVDAQPGAGLACLRNILALSLAPGALIYRALSKAAPFRSDLIGFLAGIGVSALGYLATRITCRNDDPLHVLLFHFLPVIAMSAAGAAIGRALFRRVSPKREMTAGFLDRGL